MVSHTPGCVNGYTWIVRDMERTEKKSPDTPCFFLTWFLGVYATGYLISHFFTPVLKFPVMVFAFPFFIIVLTNVMHPVFRYIKGALPIAIIAITLLSTIFEKKLFQPIHFEVFKELSTHIRHWEKQFGETNMLRIMNMSDPDYLNYYARQTGPPHQLDLSIINYGDAKTLDTILSASTKPYLVLGYSGRHTPIQFLNQSLKYFPNIVKIYQYNNSAITLLSRSEPTSHSAFKMIRHTPLSKVNSGWDFDTSKLVPSTQQYLADSTHIYRPQLILPIDKLLKNNHHFVRISLSADVKSNNEITLVAVPETKDGETSAG